MNTTYGITLVFTQFVNRLYPWKRNVYVCVFNISIRIYIRIVKQSFTWLNVVKEIDLSSVLREWIFIEQGHIFDKLQYVSICVVFTVNMMFDLNKWTTVLKTLSNFFKSENQHTSIWGWFVDRTHFSDDIKVVLWR